MHKASTNSTSPRQSASSSDPPVAFSIATRTVTTILPMAGNLSDTSFLQPSIPYHHGSSLVDEHLDRSRSLSDLNREAQEPPEYSTETLDRGSNQQDAQEGGSTNDASTGGTPIDGSENSTNQQDDASKGKRRNKINKKNGKLDARSKLEKSRQSARECRARKKLRYQYLEDLVCNREKAVVKLREELAMFCELSKQIDTGTLSEADRKLLLDQSNDSNNRS